MEDKGLWQLKGPIHTNAYWLYHLCSQHHKAENRGAASCCQAANPKHGFNRTIIFTLPEQNIKFDEHVLWASSI